jgi:hypothetical protein
MKTRCYFILGVCFLLLLSQNCSRKTPSVNQLSIGAKNARDLRSATSPTPENDLINQTFDTIYTIIRKDYCPIVTKYYLKTCCDSFYVLDTLFQAFFSHKKYSQVFIYPERKLDSLVNYTSNEITFTLPDNLKNKINFVLLHNRIDFPSLKSKPKKIYVLLAFSHVAFNKHKNDAVVEVHVDSTTNYMKNYIFHIKLINNKWKIIEYFGAVFN